MFLYSNWFTQLKGSTFLANWNYKLIFQTNKNQGYCLGIIKTWKNKIPVETWDIAHGHKVLDMETLENLWINLQKFHSGDQPIAKAIKIPLCLFYFLLKKKIVVPIS